jgi:ABC-2 type transport system ATP-binding protein
VLTEGVMKTDTVPGGLTVLALRITAPDGRLLIAPSDARFKPGVTALIGANGSGKSTLLRAIATLHPIAGGAIVLDGVNAARDRRLFLERLVFLPQNFATYPELTGQECLEYSLRLRGAGRRQAKSAAIAWLDAVGLRQAARTKTGAYSQGMLQRLGFAYAMQLDVSLYLLDEPFAGVDPESRNAMTDLLFQPGGERTVIVSTHYVDEMLARGAAVARIAAGSLVMEC